MCLEIDVGTKYTGKLLVGTSSLLAEIMFLAEVLAQVVVGAVILMQPVRIAKMTEKVITAQMSVQFIIVHIALLAKLAKRVALVAFVIQIALPSVPRQLSLCVAAPFMREYL